MVIRHNLSGMNANRNLNINNDAAAKASEKLSSGYRINRAGDDAAGLAISEKMRSQIRGLDQGSTNAQDGISLIQTSEGALNETQSMLQRLKTLATQAANDTLTSSDRGQINTEVTQLQSEISRLATQTKFNGLQVLNSASGVLSFQVGGDAGQKITLNLTSATATTLGVDSSNFSLSTRSKASAALATLDTAINSVSTKRANLGAVQNRLEHTVTATDNTSENLSAAESRIRDVDMAKEYLNYSSQNTLVQAAQSMLSQANSNSQNVLQLLRG
ncbi:flagellin [Clostridium sp. BL-8]|uniref:flagellin N-terminal helical domain-containing protein n=1 Tax=Clostridium sp. BL-8 TaxID=349938 RepID=UPI00098BCF6F|nr:flagellin [Clostridium sp. BL-8]OOM79977.1 flagellin [Clostridium sp. BL-8]